MVQWQCLSFDQLDKQQLYALLKLRSDVFIVEQACPYPDIDGKDIQPGVLHLLGWQDNTLVASVRLLPAGLTFPSVSIGRVVTHKDYRGGGLLRHIPRRRAWWCMRASVARLTCTTTCGMLGTVWFREKEATGDRRRHAACRGPVGANGGLRCEAANKF